MALIVDENVVPTMSEPVYVIGDVVPWKSASGINNTTPVVVFRLQVPSLAITTAVELQAGAVSEGSHKRILKADNDVPWSFESGVKASISPSWPDVLSDWGDGVIGALTDTDITADPHVDGGVAGTHVPLTVLHTTYGIEVATPENVVSGLKVTVVPVNVHVPSLATMIDVFVQPVEIVSPASQSLRDELFNETLP